MFIYYSYIDEGRNPLLYTKDCLIEALKKNEEIKGKIVTFGSFRDLLLNELEKEFQNEFKEYRKYRENESKSNEEK